MCVSDSYKVTGVFMLYQNEYKREGFWFFICQKELNACSFISHLIKGMIFYIQYLYVYVKEMISGTGPSVRDLNY